MSVNDCLNCNDARLQLLLVVESATISKVIREHLMFPRVLEADQVLPGALVQALELHDLHLFVDALALEAAEARLQIAHYLVARVPTTAAAYETAIGR